MHFKLVHIYGLYLFTFFLPLEIVFYFIWNMLLRFSEIYFHTHQPPHKPLAIWISPAVRAVYLSTLPHLIMYYIYVCVCVCIVLSTPSYSIYMIWRVEYFCTRTRPLFISCAIVGKRKENFSLCCCAAAVDFVLLARRRRAYSARATAWFLIFFKQFALYVRRQFGANSAHDVCCAHKHTRK